MSQIDKIKRLQEEIRIAEESEENKRRLSYWEENEGTDALARPVPKKDMLPFTVELDGNANGRVVGYTLSELLATPENYVQYTLETNLMRFREFEDCTPISKTVSYFSGSGFEKSLFGAAQVMNENCNWVGRDNSITERVPLESIELPDFLENPVMKETIPFCEKMMELVDDDFQVIFPQWNRSSWGVAWHLRGIDNLLMDYMEEPEWVEEFVGHINKGRMQWTSQRSKYLKEELYPCSLYNDEVNIPIVSPAMYEEFILPSEIEIANFHGGMNYWHSCGNTTPFMPMINTIPGLAMAHVSGWSDLKTAAKTYDPNIALQIGVKSYTDIQSADEAHIRQQLEEMLTYSKGHRATVAVDAIEIVSTVEEDMKQVKNWINYANKILLNR